jgi:hypothetical protein
MRGWLGAAGAWGQCAPATLIRRVRAAPQLHCWAEAEDMVIKVATGVT